MNQSAEKTSITTSIKAKLKKSDDQTNFDNYRVAANISEYHINKDDNINK